MNPSNINFDKGRNEKIISTLQIGNVGVNDSLKRYLQYLPNPCISYKNHFK